MRFELRFITGKQAGIAYIKERQFQVKEAAKEKVHSLARAGYLWMGERIRGGGLKVTDRNMIGET